MTAALALIAAVAAATFFGACERHFLTTEQMRLRRWARDTVRGGRPDEHGGAAGYGDRVGPVRTGQSVAVAVAAASIVALFADRGVGSVPAAVLGATAIAALVYLTADVLPRSVSAHQLTPPSVGSRRFLAAAVWLLSPLTVLSERVARGVTRRALGDERAAAEAQAEQVLVEGEREGLVDRDEREMMQSVLEFGNTRVEEIMTPVERMAAAGGEATAGEIAGIVRRTGFSRIPIRGNASAGVIGMAHVLDLFRVSTGQRPAVRPVMTCEAETRCDRLLREMRRERRHLAMVERAGHVVGMVTLEDLVEELFGDIRDEHDRHPETSRRAFVVDGQMTIAEISSARGIDLPTSGETTVAGFVIERLGRIPRAGDAIVFRGWTIDVLDATPRRIRKVRFRRRMPFPR